MSSTSDLPHYDAPPLVETAFSVMFPPAPTLSNAQLGRFWASVHKEFDRAVELPPLDFMAEMFEGQPPGWLPAGGGWWPSPMQPLRLQLLGRSGARLLQLQCDRLVYNWIKSGENSTYPRYNEICRRFLDWWGKYRAFAADQGGGDLRPWHWELAYVNMIPAGDLWQAVEDWPGVLPGLMGSQRTVAGGQEEWVNREWTFRFCAPNARLRVRTQRVVGGEEPAGGNRRSDSLRLELVARGPMPGGLGDEDLAGALGRGHEMIVRSFRAFGSEAANRAWGLRV